MTEQPPRPGARMKLHWSPRSPFVRKVMVAAHELGLADRIDRVRTVVRMIQPNADLLPDNPLSKIPTLVLADGTVLFDSVVICEYLDALAGGGTLFPPSGPERWTALARHALANGLLFLAIEEGLVDDAYVTSRTTGWEDVRRTVAAYWPARVERRTGVGEADLRAAVRLIASADRALLLTARGSEQHSHGTDTVSAWIDLALALGLPGTITPDSDAGAAEAAEWAALEVRRLADELGVPKGLAEIGVGESDIGVLSAMTLADACLSTNPREADQADIETLFRAAM